METELRGESEEATGAARDEAVREIVASYEHALREADRLGPGVGESNLRNSIQMALRDVAQIAILVAERQKESPIPEEIVRKQPNQDFHTSRRDLDFQLKATAASQISYEGVDQRSATTWMRSFRGVAAFAMGGAVLTGIVLGHHVGGIDPRLFGAVGGGTIGLVVLAIYGL